MKYEMTFPRLNDPSYQTLKWASLVVLPAIAAFYYQVGQLWHWPHIEEVVGTIASTEAFLGAVLGVSSRYYYKDGNNYDGELNVRTNDDGTKNFELDLSKSPEDLESKKTINFKVNSVDPLRP